MSAAGELIATRTRAGYAVLAAAVAASVSLGASLAAAASDPWLDRVRRFEPGTSAGFGAGELPRIVLGRPQGAGALQGSLDVVSLGNAGIIEVRFADNAVMDGPGDDLAIYENAFHAGDENGPIFTEFALIEVSRDGKTWRAFPYDAQSGEGLAGRQPVYANSSNAIDPLAAEGGGDRFDIGEVGLDYVTAVRITDAGSLIDDVGNHSYAGTKGGFDLDAAAALNSTALARLYGVVTVAGSPAADIRVRVRAVAEQRWQRRKTRADGSYQLRRLLPQGDYVVRAGPRGEAWQETHVFLGLEQMLVEADFALP
ncbi:MAG: hypothetical protein HY899_07120 [Deltaproteobacteria bacterium]|nr:hypothetical protein [Deltaproteobacteria bacterium]